MTKAFDGVQILEIGQAFNGPHAALMFAQHGARVVKLEPPVGDMMRFRSHDTVESHEFVMLNSNKESIVINLKDPRGRQIIIDSIGDFDVVIENLAPGAMGRLGLDPQVLCEQNPRLVYASGKGYGTEGPYAEMPAMDITVQAMSGVIASTGFPDGPPVKTGPALVDILAGVTLFSAAVSALYQREVTGLGQFVEVSMHDSVYPAMASPLGAIYNDSTREIPERTGNRHSGMAVTPYNVYPAADGWVSLFCFSDRHFQLAMQVMGLDELIADERFATKWERLRNMEELDVIIAGFTSTHDRWEVVRLLQAAGVPAAPVQTIHEVAEDEHWKQRGMIQVVDHPRRGKVNVAGSAMHMSRSITGPMRTAPTLGTSTISYLREFCGYDEAQIADLLAERVVFAGTDEEAE